MLPTLNLVLIELEGECFEKNALTVLNREKKKKREREESKDAVKALIKLSFIIRK